MTSTDYKINSIFKRFTYIDINKILQSEENIKDVSWFTNINLV